MNDDQYMKTYFQRRVTGLAQQAATEQYPINRADNQRKKAIEAHTRGMHSVLGWLIPNKYTLPHDQYDMHGNNLSARLRVTEYQRQLAMPWNNTFLPPELADTTDRYNSFGAAQMTRQKQFTIPSVYTQFYAFQKALSTAFGNLDPNG